MKLSSALLVSLPFWVSSFQPLPVSHRVGVLTTLSSFEGSGEDDGEAIFGGHDVPGMPDKLPPAPPIDEDNPGGGQMFRNLMARAKEGPSKPTPTMDNQPSGYPDQQQTPQYGAPAATPQYGVPATTPQYGAPATTPQYGVPAATPQYGVPATTPQYGVPAATPQYGAPAATPQYGVPATTPQMQPQQQQQGVDPYVLYQSQLQAWQQQMTAYAQFCASNPEAAAQMTMPPPPPPPGQVAPPIVQQGQVPQQPIVPPPVQQEQTPPKTPVDSNEPKNAYDYLPKGDGRNTQAFEVNNAADVYFAQLKRDSTVRTEARKKGDLKTANGVFADEGIAIIGDVLSPELVASRREMLQKNGGEFETSRDEMILPQNFISEEEVDKTYAGSSYKQKLMEARKNRLSSIAPVTSAVPEANTFNLASTADVTNQPPTTGAIAQESSELQTSSEESKPNFALPVKNESEIGEIAAPSMEDSEETRKSIRTLMGLLLKHRGGNGFGHGRLKDAEAKKLEEMSAEVLALLKSESSGVDNSPPPAAVCPVDHGSQPPSSPPPVNTVVSFPETYQVTQKDEEEIKEIEEAVSNNDLGENTKRLQKVYETLKLLTGDKKFGLKDVNPDEIEDARTAIADMREILMEELN